MRLITTIITVALAASGLGLPAHSSKVEVLKSEYTNLHSVSGISEQPVDSGNDNSLLFPSGIILSAAWPWLFESKDALGDSNNPDFDIVGVRVRKEDAQLSFQVDFSTSQNLAAIAAGNGELEFQFDTNGDGQEDFFLSSAAFQSEGTSDGVLRESKNETAIMGCPVRVGVVSGLAIYATLSSACLQSSGNLGLRVEVKISGSTIDASPDSSWHSTGLKYVCSKQNKGQSFFESGTKYFCMLTSGTLSKGKWGILPESRVTDANYLKMFVCSINQKGLIITIERSTGKSSYTCGKSNGKWTFISAAAIQAAQAKAAASARAKKVASARYSTHKAFFQCRLDASSKAPYAEVADNGRTLILNYVGRYQFAAIGLLWQDYQCVANYLKMPRSVQSKIDNTRALDGTLEGKWGSISTFWNYHPDSGLNITFTLVR